MYQVFAKEVAAVRRSSAMERRDDFKNPACRVVTWKCHNKENQIVIK